MIIDAKKHRPNLSEIAYHEIKEMILTGELTQGERIVLERMSEKLNLSITPIREALNKLGQEDLIHVTPRSSYAVVTLSQDNIRDILDLREMLETFALKTAGENLSSFPIDFFREHFKKPNLPRNYRKFMESDIKFHETIIATSKNKKLTKLFGYIHNSERLMMVPSARIEGRIGRATREHLEILSAIEKGEVDEAVRRLGSHIQHVKQLLLQTIMERTP